MPVRGEIVAGPGDFEFEVLDADPRRVKRLKVHPRAAPRRRNRARRAATARSPTAAARRASPDDRAASALAPGDKCVPEDRHRRSLDSAPAALATAPGAASLRRSSSPGAGRDAAIAFVGGAAGALAMPPVDFAPALIVPMTLAVWLIDGVGRSRPRAAATRWASLSAAFGAGWWWGFGYFVAGLWWLGSAFLVDADKFAWALPLGVLGLPAALAFFPALGFALAQADLARRRDARPGAGGRPRARANGCAASCSPAFPGTKSAWRSGQNLVLAQIASIVGLHGLTLAAVAIFAAPATLWTESAAPRRWAADDLGGARARGDLRLRRVAARRAGERRRCPASNCASCSPTSRKGADFAPGQRAGDRAPIISPCPIARPRPRPPASPTSRI